MDFSVYVSGYEKNRSTTNLLIDDNPDLELVSSEHVCETTGCKIMDGLPHETLLSISLPDMERGCERSESGRSWSSGGASCKYFNASAGEEVAEVQNSGE